MTDADTGRPDDSWDSLVERFYVSEIASTVPDGEGAVSPDSLANSVETDLADRLLEDALAEMQADAEVTSYIDRLVREGKMDADFPARYDKAIVEKARAIGIAEEDIQDIFEGSNFRATIEYMTGARLEAEVHSLRATAGTEVDPDVEYMRTGYAEKLKVANEILKSVPEGVDHQPLIAALDLIFPHTEDLYGLDTVDIRTLIALHAPEVFYDERRRLLTNLGGLATQLAPLTEMLDSDGADDAHHELAERILNSAGKIGAVSAMEALGMGLDTASFSRYAAGIKERAKTSVEAAPKGKNAALLIRIVLDVKATMTYRRILQGVAQGDSPVLAEYADKAQALIDAQQKTDDIGDD